MCGIAGAVGLRTEALVLERMLDSIRHRGPDDSGTLIAGEIAIGMRRLSIIDIAHGHQPIFNDDATLSIVFNGEIYNYRELRRELEAEGRRFRTQSDTEVILRLFERDGPDCVSALRGMFTFAIADTRRNRLFIARDRLGIKPLYLYQAGRELVFGSEIKALLEHPAVPREPEPAALADYLTLRYVPGPRSLFADIEKFPPAHWLLWDNGELRWQRYWGLEGLAPDSAVRPDGEYQERFDELFNESVRLRMISDVPLGTFLSGGLDSGAIAASMSGRADSPVRSFSVGFDWQGDELEGARETARKLACNHTEVLCQAEDFAQLPQLVWHLDEPVGDAIVMPMFLLSKRAREDVTVVLTGEGADETMAGYFMHKVLDRTALYRRTVPAPLRALGRFGAGLAPPALLDRLFDYPGSLGGKGKQRLLEYLKVIETGDLDARYRFLISLFDSDDLKRLWPDRPEPAGDATALAAGAQDLERILRQQYAHWLPDDILCKQDKMTMANSVEGRVPFMDHKLVEFLATVPRHLKLGRVGNKAILRNYLHRRLPHLDRRKKAAFYIPVDNYLRQGPLAKLSDELLSEDSVKRRGLFQWEEVRHLRSSVSEGEFLYGKQVFSLLALELWFRIFIENESGWDVGPPSPPPRHLDWTPAR
ncbi:asparagine synthase (glutamine-hydrolyzing) [Algihabitans albus]|uniref:asparagine synthase (glutamine-hydrolyzing) n=1 Tax=Algihabitans albus TaxID=2164067 RepID=UPI000E5D2F7D|nr:asparagine synthase (glutamine-hydrolyzing) [Algihabitans albus]